MVAGVGLFVCILRAITNSEKLTAEEKSGMCYLVGAVVWAIFGVVVVLIVNRRMPLRGIWIPGEPFNQAKVFRFIFAITFWPIPVIGCVANEFEK